MALRGDRLHRAPGVLAPRLRHPNRCPSDRVRVQRPRDAPGRGHLRPPERLVDQDPGKRRHDSRRNAAAHHGAPRRGARLSRVQHPRRRMEGGRRSARLTETPWGRCGGLVWDQIPFHERTQGPCLWRGQGVGTTLATFTPAGKWAPGATHAVVPTTSYFKAGRPRDRTLGVVDFSIFPHLDAFPSNTMPEADRWASDIGGP